MKRALLICPDKFGYHENIRRELRGRGYQMLYVEDCPASNSLEREVVHFSARYAKWAGDAWFTPLLERGNFDLIIVINGQCLSVEMMTRLLLDSPNAQTVFYAWSPARHLGGGKMFELARLFRTAYSANEDDVRTLAALHYLPPFYRSESHLEPIQDRPLYEFLLLGSAHSDRVATWNRIRRLFPACTSTRAELHTPSKIALAARQLFEGYPVGDAWSPLVTCAHHTPVDARNLMAQSRILVDIHHPDQTGLTLRIIESLGAQRKLITTNARVTGHDFYRPENILVIDRHNPVIPSDFILGEYRVIPPAIRQSYSLSAWMDVLLGARPYWDHRN